MDARTDKSCFCNPTQQLHITLIFISNLHKLLSKMIHPNFFPGFANYEYRERINENVWPNLARIWSIPAAQQRQPAAGARVLRRGGNVVEPPPLRGYKHGRLTPLNTPAQNVSAAALLSYIIDPIHPLMDSYTDTKHTPCLIKGCLVLTGRFETFKRRHIVKNFWHYR